MYSGLQTVGDCFNGVHDFKMKKPAFERASFLCFIVSRARHQLLQHKRQNSALIVVHFDRRVDTQQQRESLVGQPV